VPACVGRVRRGGKSARSALRLDSGDEPCVGGMAEAELDDRFGKTPDPAQRLLQVARVRMLARTAGIRRIDAGPAAIALTSYDRAAAKPIDDLVEKNGRWIAAEGIAEPIERANRIEELLGAMID
jgi:transcription-repair coupling factor (superfamily II helicase)